MFGYNPVLLHYFITYRCNCFCTFCDIWKMKEPRAGKDAEIHDVDRNLHAAYRLGARFVDFTGGEPLMHPDLPHMLKMAKIIGFRTSVTTNCLLYPRRAKELAGLVDLLHFSLDAASPGLHNALRGKKAFFAVMESIDTARRLDEKPDILFTVTDRNIDQLEKLERFCRKTGLLLIVNPVFTHLSPNPLKTENLHRLRRRHKVQNVYVNKAFLNFKLAGGNDIRKPRCRAVSSTLVISPYNRLLLPCFHFCMDTVPIKNALENIPGTDTFAWHRSRQGRFDFCKGCSLNCYFDPSFLYKFDRYFFESLSAKAGYVWDKNIRKLLFPAKRDGRPAAEIMAEMNNTPDPKSRFHQAPTIAVKDEYF